MKKTRSFRVSLHGHSPESDGLSSIREIVEAGGRSKIHFLGLADHNTTAGIPGLYREVASYNRSHEHQIQAVGGIEVKFADSGDVIISKPGPIDYAFLAWAEGVAVKRGTMPAVRAINEAVRRFGAMVTFAHVDCPFAGSVSSARLSEIVKKLTPRVRRHIAMEVRNYATAVFSVLTVAREERLEALAGQLGLATVGFSDFHHAWMVKKQVSAFQASVPTGLALKKAIKTRTIKAAWRESLGLFEWFRLTWTVGRALLLFKLKYAGWNLPVFRPEPSLATK